jgi:hypothetical protein
MLFLLNLVVHIYFFIYTFYSTRDALGSAYQKPSLESFCDGLIQEKYNLVQLGVINTAGTSNKALVSQQKDKSKNPKSNILATITSKTIVPNPLSQIQLLTVTKEQSLKIKRLTDCNFCGKDGHDESKCFKKMIALESMMKNHNISIDSTSYYFYFSSSSHGHALSSSSHGHALSSSHFLFNVIFTSDEWLIDSGASYHMDKDKAIFSALNECNTKKIFIGDDISLSVVRSREIQVDNVHFNDVLCVPSLSCNLL